MITVATHLWDPTEASFEFSRCYDEGWVERLYRGFKRNLTAPFRFVVFTDRLREYGEPIEQRPLIRRPIGYASCCEPLKLDTPTIICGLDTVIVGNIDHMADYCLTADRQAIPRDPIFREKQCNAVQLVPAGQKAALWDRFDGQNDMDWANANPHNVIDAIWPGEVMSYREQILHFGWDGVRIAYFHGRLKPHELEHDQMIQRHWR